jgi:hypothetical protein
VRSKKEEVSEAVAAGNVTAPILAARAILFPSEFSGRRAALAAGPGRSARLVDGAEGSRGPEGDPDDVLAALDSLGLLDRDSMRTK